MKLSFTISASPTRFAAVAQQRDLRSSIEYLAGLGYEGVELAIRDPAQVNLDEAAATAARVGVGVPAIGTGQAFLEEGMALTAPEAGVRELAAAGKIRFGFPPYNGLHSHDRLEQHMPTPKLTLMEDGALLELFNDCYGTKQDYNELSQFGHEIFAFHFSRTKRWPL